MAGFLDWWKYGQQYVTVDFIRVMDHCEKPKMVIYDSQTQSWGSPEDGIFATDIKDAPIVWATLLNRVTIFFGKSAHNKSRNRTTW